ncbi:MAG: type II toxin-antitoxin system VapC family toxin [Solirubrobacteraceae bacterium]
MSSVSTSGEIAYLDTSAYVKLVLGEPESTALREELSRWQARVSSRLLIVESLRACSRYGAAFATRALAGLSDLALLPMDDALLHAAAALQPPSLRSLDAIHLATALSIRDCVGLVFCYDERLVDAAVSAGLVVARPGPASAS